MKTARSFVALLLAPLLLLSLSPPLHAAVTGRSEDTSLSGTEKVLLDSSGVDTWATINRIWGSAQTLTGSIAVSGSGNWDFSGGSGAFKTSTGANVFGGSSHTFASDISPAISDGAALGSTTYMWSDAFLASGAVLNFNNGNVVLTHSAGILTMGTGELRVTTPGTNSASVPTLGSTSTMTNKTLTSPVINGATSSGSTAINLGGNSGTFTTPSGANVFTGSSHSFGSKLFPTTDDGAALGDTTHHFSDLFLATGAVLNFNNGNVAVTHSSGILTMGTGELRITTPGTNAASVPTLGSTSTMTNKTLTSPVIATGLTASGSAANTFAGSTGTFITSTGANTFKGSAHNFDAVLQPTTDDAAALGTTLLGFSDLFLASGGTLHFANTDWVATHSTGILTVGTGDLRVTTAGTNTASVVTVGGTQTLTNKTLTSPTITGPGISGTSAFTGAITTTGAITQTSASATAFESGLNGGTNPVFRLVNNISSQATGISITGRAAAAGADITVLSSGTNENLVINAKGSGTISLNPTGTGNIVLSRAATGVSLAVTGALTTSSASAAFGYAAGSGGTVTQATDRTTGVTLSKTTGVITTDSTSLAAGAEAEFTVTNTVVEATDTVIVNITPGGTGTPMAYVSGVSAGSFKITITNLHASTADTSADVINFTVIKGKSS